MSPPAGQERGAESGLSRRARAERWSQWSLRRGMETLPEALAAFLRPRGVELRCHAPLRSLRRRHDGRWQVGTPAALGGGGSSSPKIWFLSPPGVAQGLGCWLREVLGALGSCPVIWGCWDAPGPVP